MHKPIMTLREIVDAEQPEAQGAVRSGDLLGWLRVKLAEAQSALQAREQMEACWRTGSDETWKAVAATHPSTKGKMWTKKERLEESDRQGRIAVKCRREVEMLKAVISAISQPNIRS